MFFALLFSTLAIAISEIGDKTQFITLCLVSRFRRPVPILLGIFSAALVSNIAAGLLGDSLGHWLHGGLLHGIVAASFFANAVWAMLPEKEEGECAAVAPHGIFFASLWSFLVAEMGDKTQVAAVTLAAHFHAPVAVILGTTIGVMIPNIPVVLAGHKILVRVPLRVIRLGSGALFCALGFYELIQLV